MRQPLVAAALLAAGCLASACSGASGDTQARGATAQASASSSASPSASATASASVTPSAAPTPSATPSPVRKKMLPLGGRFLFPQYRVVAYYGNSETAALGVLGEGPAEDAARRVYEAGKPFVAAGGKPVMGAFEFIASVAQASPGPDGDYSFLTPPERVYKYLVEARKAKMLMVLDLQPGRASFLEQAKHYEFFWKQPDVGIALDPEWVLREGQKPGRQIGRTSAAEINEVSAYIARIRAQYDLPQKLFIVHQFRQSMIPDRDAVVSRSGLATMFHIDGFGSQGVKKEVYAVLAPRDPRFAIGYKLFYDEDIDMMTPAEAMALRPQPDLISYQ